MQRVLIFGGTGFVGRHIVKALLEDDKPYEICVVARSPSNDQASQISKEKGTRIFHQGSLLSPETFEHLLTPGSIVINTVGILFPTSKQSFEQVHHQAVGELAKIAQKKGVAALVHISALGADKTSASLYAASKARGEEALQTHFPKATILRPSVIFGQGDQFLNRFSQMASFSPFLPLIGGGQTQFQPVHVGDVAKAVVAILKNPALQGNIYELGGPQAYTFKTILEMLLAYEGRNRLLLPIPFSFARWLGKVGQCMPSPVLTEDQVELLKCDNLTTEKANTFKTLGITPLALKDYLEDMKR